MVFQAPVLMDWRTIARNIELPLEIMGFPAAERRRRSEELLRLVELEGFGDAPSVGAVRRDAAAGRRSPGLSPSTRSCC